MDQRTGVSPNASFSQGHEPAVAYYWRGEVLRSRHVSAVVHSGRVELPAPPARLLADWQRDITCHLALAPGEVEALSLARARTRWPDYHLGVQAVAHWLRPLGLSEALANCDVALMACRGAQYHHDAAQYGDMAFCNLFLSEDKGLDLHFPLSGHRIPLTRGTVVLFDTGQPHAVIARHSHGFEACDFAPEHDHAQVFLTWEMPVETIAMARALELTFDVDPATAERLQEEQVWLHGAPAQVCPASGRWCPAD